LPEVWPSHYENRPHPPRLEFGSWSGILASPDFFPEPLAQKALGTVADPNFEMTENLNDFAAF
jgi:hypothetical protein